MGCKSGERLFTTLLYMCLMLLTEKVQAAQEYLPPKHGTAPSTAHHLPHSPQGQPGNAETQGEPANYDFSYEVEDNAVSLDFGHSERRVNDQASGSYHVLLPDGRTQIVDYEAGPNGFRPQIRYEGTASVSSGSLGTSGSSGRNGAGGGYNYNAASNQAPVRQAPPSRLSTTAPAMSSTTTKK